MSVQDQIALLRGAVAVPKEPSEVVADAALKAWIEHPGDGVPRDWFVCAMRAGNAATPPAYAEALAAVLDGYEAMQADAARLNGLVSNEAWVGWNREGELCRVWVRSADEDDFRPVPVCGWDVFFDDARKAIDAALAKLGEKA